MGNTSRRAFVRKLALVPETALPSAGERTLVCVFLRGAADTLNMVVPHGDDDYYKLRPTIAIPTSAALRLDEF